MEVAKGFDEGVNGEVRATVMRDTIKFQTTDGESYSWGKGCARDKTIFDNGCCNEIFAFDVGDGC